MSGICSRVTQSALRFTFVLAIVAVAALRLIGSPQTSLAATDFAAGDTVVVNTDSLSLRASASSTADVVESMSDGTWATIVDGPTDADGFPWYELDVDGTTGWSDAEYLAAASSDAADLPAGTVVSVITTSLNLRSAAGTDPSVLSVLSAGDEGTVVSGPDSVDGSNWYELDVDGTTGWAVRDYLAFADSGDSFATGDLVLVNTDALTVRDDATTSGNAVETLAGGDTITIVSGPTDADGYSWYEVKTDDATGWVAGEFLRAA
jgi:uncharacterized protein YraI